MSFFADDPPLALTLESLHPLMKTVCALFLYLFVTVTGGHSQCGGLTEVVRQPPLVYPAIARAAHVNGTVISIIKLSRQGTVDSIEVLGGPPMLIEPTIRALRQMRVNSFTGPRSCPFVVTYRMPSKSAVVNMPSDMQHFSVTAFAGYIQD